MQNVTATGLSAPIFCYHKRISTAIPARFYDTGSPLNKYNKCLRRPLSFQPATAPGRWSRCFSGHRRLPFVLMALPLIVSTKIRCRYCGSEQCCGIKPLRSAKIYILPSFASYAPHRMVLLQKIGQNENEHQHTIFFEKQRNNSCRNQ